MAFANIITDIINNSLYLSLAVSGIWLIVVLILVIIWIVTANKRKKGVDVSALAALASSDKPISDAAPNADPKEVMAILSIERVAASTALSAVKDARKNKRISSTVRDSLLNRYKARIAKIDADLKRRSGAQEYRSLAQSLEESRDRLRGEVKATPPPPPTAPASSKPLPPPPPPSSTPGIPSQAPPVPGTPRPPTVPTSGPPSAGPPSATGSAPKPASPIPTPPKIPTVGPSSSKSPSTVVPPSVAPPTVSSPPMPPSVPKSPPTTSPTTPPTVSSGAPPPVPTSAPAPGTPDSAQGDSQSISGLRMEMLKELARLKKFMSEEGG